VPPARRQYGYYTMPVLADGRLVARLDPKYERQARRLVLRGFHIEDGVEPDLAGGAAATAARRLADHLGAEQLIAGSELAPALAARLGLDAPAPSALSSWPAQPPRR
jgi:uncharacterized protein